MVSTGSSLRPFTISMLASAAGVNVETIRYYQRRGLMSQPARPTGGIRRYAESDADRLRFIKRAQAMGFTLEEVASLLKLRTRRSCRATRELAITKLNLIERSIRELRGLQAELARLVDECSANDEDSRCPVIEQLGR